MVGDVRGGRGTVRRGRASRARYARQRWAQPSPSTDARRRPVQPDEGFDNGGPPQRSRKKSIVLARPEVKLSESFVVRESVSDVWRSSLRAVLLLRGEDQSGTALRVRRGAGWGGKPRAARLGGTPPARQGDVRRTVCASPTRPAGTYPPGRRCRRCPSPRRRTATILARTTPDTVTNMPGRAAPARHVRRQVDLVRACPWH